MALVVYAVLAMGAGVCLALQASANNRFRENLDSREFAAFFSICGTIVTASLAMLIVRPTIPSMQSIRETQWWNWIGGPLGALVVLAGASLISKLGAALFIALVVGGQLACALLLDHYELMGLKHQALSAGRVIGGLLVVAGVVCIKFL